MTDGQSRGPSPANGAGITRREVFGAVGATAALAALPATLAAQGLIEPVRAGSPTRLYPHESSTRATIDLSGLWRFKLDPQDSGESARWFDGLTNSRSIPVPCSWNDLFDDAKNYTGAAWYETEFRVDRGWAGRRLYLRFGSAVYRAKVWLNGRLIGEHVGGHLPFALEATDAVRLGAPNRLVVMVENKLRLDRVPAIPNPETSRLHTHHYPQTTYDFFPYSGLHRPVLLFSVPRQHVHDVTVTTAREGSTGVVEVAFTVEGGWSGLARLMLEGGSGPVSAPVEVRGGSGRGVLRLPRARLWSPDDPFLHRLTVALGGAGQPVDEYHLKIGIRTIEVRGDQLLLNGRPVFLTGFGKHEDFILHGRGLDLAALVRDFELMKWMGANSFRTSHYPYAEEAMMLADEYGFLVIDETPGVSLVFSDTPEIIEARRQQLSRALTELIDRDKNHPCVIMWSIANEPLTKPFHTVDDPPPTSVEKGRVFFAGLFDQARRLDKTRPVVLVSLQGGPAEWVGLGDVICTNSYSGWYAVSGRLDDAEAAVDKEVRDLRARHGKKPIFYTEFGADAAPGLHAQPAEMWTEEYQAEMVAMYLRVLARYPYVIGSHPWAFADFKTSQSIMRVGGLNFKGAFTRDRRPKLVAHTLREAWTGKKVKLPSATR